MKVFYAGLFISSFLLACNIEGNLNPVFEGRSYATETYDAFEGIKDGIPTVYRNGADWFICNPTDNFVYVFNSGAAVVNTDATQVQCVESLFSHTSVTTDSRPVAARP